MGARMILLGVLILLGSTGCGRIGITLLQRDAGADATASVGVEPGASVDAAEADAASGDVGDSAAATDASEPDTGARGPDVSDVEAGVTIEGGMASEAGLSDCRLTVDGSVVGYRSGETGTLQSAYVLSLEATGRCAAPADCGAATGADLVQSACDFSPCQMWEAYEIGPQHFALRNVATGACFYMTSTAQGTQLLAWECSSANKELWQATCASADTWRLISDFSREALQGDGQTSPDASIIQEPVTDSGQQLWTIHESTMPITVLLPTSERDPQAWRYTTAAPAADWMQTAFDDGAWQSGVGGFGDRERGFTPARTSWTTSDLWIRRSFQLDNVPASLSVRVYHDEDVEVYINGVTTFSEGGWSQGYRTETVPAAVLGSLQPGSNSIAVHCHDTSAPRFLDVGLAVVTWQ